MLFQWSWTVYVDALVGTPPPPPPVPVFVSPKAVLFSRKGCYVSMLGAGGSGGKFVDVAGVF